MSNLEKLHKDKDVTQIILGERILDIVYEYAKEHKMTTANVLGVLETIKLNIYQDQLEALDD